MASPRTVRILTNVASLPPETDGVKLELSPYPPEPLGTLGVVRAFLGAGRHDALLLNYRVRELILLGFLKTLFPWHRCRIMAMDLVLTVPDLSTMAARIKWSVMRLGLRGISRFLVYFRNTEGLTECYGISPDRFRYVPYKVNSRAKILETPVADDGYVFCGGKSRRDFGTLLKAVDGLDLAVKLVTPPNTEIAEHGSFLDESRVPANVEIIHDDGTPESFISQLAHARVVVLPILRRNISSSGLGVYLMAMALGKCVVISSGPAVDGIIPEGCAEIVPPEDPGALRKALDRVWRDQAYREAMAARGREFALSLGDDRRLVESIAREVVREVSA